MNGRYLRFAVVGLFGLLMLATVVLPVMAATVSWSGTLDTGDANLSPVRNTYYEAQAFSVDVTGSYTLTMTAGNFAPSYFGPDDGYYYLYSPSFDPANPSANLVTNDDDSGPGYLPQIVRNLTAGQQYVLISTTYSSLASGTYTSQISGPGNITLGGGTPTGGAVLPFGGDVFEPGDDRLNRSSKDRAAPVAVYCTADEIMVLKVNIDTGRAIDHASIVISQEEVEEDGVPETANLLLGEADGVQLWRLVGGRFQVNAFYQREPGKAWVFTWEDCNVFSGVHLAN